MHTVDVQIVGAGFAGSVMAQRLADMGYTVEVVESRPHIGGNAYDYTDKHGIRVHKYGPHVFHTNSDRIFSYLSQFTEWIPYEHRVLSYLDGDLYPFPININTINKLYDRDLNADQMREFLHEVAVDCRDIRTSEDFVLKMVGRDLCDKFFRGYTRKHWGHDLSELSPSVCARVPIRYDTDDRYFTDKHQYMPKDGYTAMFESMLDNPRINVELDTDYFTAKNRPHYKAMVYTGPIDRFFGYCHGRLPYRSLEFYQQTWHIKQYQEVGTINFPNEYGWTRATEFKHMTGQEHPSTSVCYEYPAGNDGEPFYPIPREVNEILYRKYRDMANELTNTVFVGRLARYRYYNMDQVVGSALSKVETVLNILKG